MAQYLFWKGSRELEVEWGNGNQPPEEVLKIGVLQERAFILDGDNHLWAGEMGGEESLKLKSSGLKARDLAVSPSHLYLNNEAGRVYKLSPELDECEEVVLHEEASSCVHGHTTAGHRVVVKRIAAGGMGVLYLSDRGELWASGEHPQLEIAPPDGAKKVSFFEGRRVTVLACGGDFNAVVAHKRDDSCPGSLEPQVFVSDCPRCSSSSVLSPLSPRSDTCPLGLDLKKSEESLSASTSTPSKNNEEDDCKKSDGSTTTTEADSYGVARDVTALADDNSDTSTEEERADRVSLLVLNTKAARQFLTRQLSWMSSGGEELLAEGPRIMDSIAPSWANVTNVASLVVEGARSVRDTLSRHMSGGSEENNSESFEEFEELNRSNASITSSFRWEWSGSEGSEEGRQERGGCRGTCVLTGARLVKSEVWAWGSADKAQLGLGDTVSRHKPVLVSGVNHIGAVWVGCGESHGGVQTLDGRCFVWGSNSKGQTSPVPHHLPFQSSPLTCGRAKAIALGDSHTTLINTEGTLYWLPRKSCSGSVSVGAGGRVICNGNLTVAKLGRGVSAESEADLAHEQCYLEELLWVSSSLVKPLVRRLNNGTFGIAEEPVTRLLSCHTEVVHATAGLTAALLSGAGSYTALSEYGEEVAASLDRYCAALCDTTAVGGFAIMARNIEPPSKLVVCLSDRLPTRKTSTEAVLAAAFLQPLSRVTVYKGMVSRGGGNGLSMWQSLCEGQESRRKEAEATKAFWELAGRIFDSLRTPGRRLVRESRGSPLSLHNASRFSSHWFILLSDALVHVTGNSTHTVHPLETLWVDTLPDSDYLQNAFVITTPEECLTLVAGSGHDKCEWLQCLQNSVRAHLGKANVPPARTASFTFTKHSLYKDAKYTGRWTGGKPEGGGKLEWSDGRVYSGQFHNGVSHGIGRLDTPGVSVYDGQWRDGLPNGHGTTRYETGDTYIGYYKDGVENGHGVRKTGRFMSSQASVYVGEWSGGMKHGYGVINNIGTGEKYLGLWSNNMKNGSGLIVTLDGIYYEGSFVQDVLTGHGVMVLEDGTHYEGELKEAGVFSGKGTLTFPSGDSFEGSLHGAWNQGVKISGVLHKHLPTSSPQRSLSKPRSLGELCVGAEDKWRSIVRQMWVALGGAGEGRGDTTRAWESVAVALSSVGGRHSDLLHTIPRLTPSLSPALIAAYLAQAFESVHHPLGRGLAELVEAYTTTYGGVLVHPLLLSHAVAELHSVTLRLYRVVRLLFPSLPPHDSFADHDDVLSMTSLMHPIILPKLYSSLLVLYSLHNKTEDDTYWKRLLKWNRHPDTTLMAFLGIDRKFWMGEEGGVKREGMFGIAVETLQQLKTTFSPMEKLIVIRNTFQELTKAVENEVGVEYVWTMDDLFPVFQYVVVRSHIQELGSEIHFIDDFMETRLKNGELGIMFTTLKACFFQILQEKISISS